jgi:chromosome partitioning protein
MDAAQVIEPDGAESVLQKKQGMRNFLAQADLARCIGVTTQTLGKQLKDLDVERRRVGRTVLIEHTGVRKILEARGFRYPNLVVAVQMLKGGSGKTSSAFNLAIRAHQYGFRVLVVDLDMQGNMTSTFGVGWKCDSFISYIRRQREFTDLVIPIEEGLDLVPSNYANSTIDIEIFSKRYDHTSLLQRPLDGIRSRYDLILLDCNPSLSALNVSAALAADIVLVPINPDTYSEEGLLKTLEEIKRVSEDQPREPSVKLFYTRFDRREATSRGFLVQYATKYGDLLLESAVHRSADVISGTSTGQSVFEMRRAGSAQSDFDSLTRELLGLIDKFGDRQDG